MPTLAIAIFVAVFAIAPFRNIHLGVLMLPAAAAVGVWLAGMPLRDVVAGFPVNILVIIAGVTIDAGLTESPVLLRVVHQRFSHPVLPPSSISSCSEAGIGGNDRVSFDRERSRGEHGIKSAQLKMALEESKPTSKIRLLHDK